VSSAALAAGADVPQVYLTDAVGDKRLRLLDLQRIALKPDESKRVVVVADPRLLAHFDDGVGRWRIAAGRYRIAVGRSAQDFALSGDVQLTARLFGV
jgi:beta-glucosidase